LPETPHQTCQLHCLLDAATPIVESDQAFKKVLKKAIRTPFYAVCRALEPLAPEDPRSEVLNTQYRKSHLGASSAGSIFQRRTKSLS
jgi:hypothetical protein